MCPIFIQVGPVTLYSYGLMVAVGFLVALALVGRHAVKEGLDRTKIQGVGLAGLVGGLLGARAGYVALHWRFFQSNPMEIVRLDHGGLVFFGGLLVGVFSGLWTARRVELPLWKTLDLMVPPLILAHAIGRLGCFLNGCCYGKPSSVSWAVAFPMDGILRHPTQLYEAFFLSLLFLALLRLESRRPLAGTVFLSYGVLYGTWRFFVEFLRSDPGRQTFGLLGMTFSQTISVVGVAVCAIWFYFRRTAPQPPAGPPAPAPKPESK